MEPFKINLGRVFRHTEPNLKLLSYFDSSIQECRIAGFCDLQSVFDAALNAFLRELDNVTLEEVIGNKKLLRKALTLSTES